MNDTKRIEIEVWNKYLEQIQNITLYTNQTNSLKDIGFDGSLDKIYKYYNNRPDFRLLSIKFIYE